MTFDYNINNQKWTSTKLLQYGTTKPEKPVIGCDYSNETWIDSAIFEAVSENGSHAFLYFLDKQDNKTNKKIHQAFLIPCENRYHVNELYKIFKRNKNGIKGKNGIQTIKCRNKNWEMETHKIHFINIGKQ
jgi:hypothetical protein